MSPVLRAADSRSFHQWCARELIRDAQNRMRAFLSTANQQPKMTIDQKLDDIIDRLERLEQRQKSGLARMEERQIEELEQTKAAAPPETGSFATIDHGDK